MRSSFVISMAVAAALGAGAVAAAPTQCDVASLQAKAPKDTTIAKAEAVAAKDKLPAYCLVEGAVATPGNSVSFRLGLPENWNGKFYFQGVGGFAGQMGRLNAGLERGYASATTDTGHVGKTGTDGSWALDNRPKEIDYGHRGTHVTTVAAKALTQSFFGAPLEQAYFSGCSNGGRQALMEAQRYPDDYDGIIAGDPSLGALGYVRRAITYQFMLKSPDRLLPATKLEVLSKAATAACDASDGVTDGIIGDPRHCKFDPAVLQCKGADAADCLTSAQLDSVRAIYAESKTPKGERIYGFPIGHEAGNTGWPLWITGRDAPTKGADGVLTYTDEQSPTGFRFVDGFFRYMAFEKDDPTYDWRKFDVQHDLPKIATITEILSPTNPDLTKLRDSKAKLLLYHGWSDPAISAYGTIDYYNKTVTALGGKQKADETVRLFLVPGMHHCAGGPGPNQFDTLTALEQWVEKKQAPEVMIATHATDGKVDRTRPLCPEPQVAKYSGKGSIDDAANFKCGLPSGERTSAL
jgi:feruloyl esterase